MKYGIDCIALNLNQRHCCLESPPVISVTECAQMQKKCVQTFKAAQCALRVGVKMHFGESSLRFNKFFQIDLTLVKLSECAATQMPSCHSKLRADLFTRSPYFCPASFNRPL